MELKKYCLVLVIWLVRAVTMQMYPDYRDPYMNPFLPPQVYMVPYIVTIPEQPLTPNMTKPPNNVNPPKNVPTPTTVAKKLKSEDTLKLPERNLRKTKSSKKIYTTAKSKTKTTKDKKRNLKITTKYITTTNNRDLLNINSYIQQILKENYSKKYFSRPNIKDLNFKISTPHKINDYVLELMRHHNLTKIKSTIRTTKAVIRNKMNRSVQTRKTKGVARNLIINFESQQKKKYSHSKTINEYINDILQNLSCNNVIRSTKSNKKTTKPSIVQKRVTKNKNKSHNKKSTIVQAKQKSKKKEILTKRNKYKVKLPKKQKIRKYLLEKTTTVAKMTLKTTGTTKMTASTTTATTTTKATTTEATTTKATTTRAPTTEATTTKVKTTTTTTTTKKSPTILPTSTSISLTTSASSATSLKSNPIIFSLPKLTIPFQRVTAATKAITRNITFTSPHKKKKVTQSKPNKHTTTYLPARKPKQKTIIRDLLSKSIELKTVEESAELPVADFEYDLNKGRRANTFSSKTINPDEYNVMIRVYDDVYHSFIIH